jgi:choline dehydrogenase-like flavoprotein
VLRPESRGRVLLTGPHPHDPVAIDANFLDDPADLHTLKRCIEFCRDVGNSTPLRPFAKREILPVPVGDAALERFMRNGTVSHSHQSCTAKMGHDALSVVDTRMRVYGIDRLRIADASVALDIDFAGPAQKRDLVHPQVRVVKIDIRARAEVAKLRRVE